MNTEKKPSTKSGRRRAVHFVLREEDCPGLIEFLDSLENRMESKTVRAILFEWFEQQIEYGTVDLIAAAVRTIHNHQLAVLQRNVNPHFVGSTGAAVPSERKQILVPAAPEHPSPFVPVSAFAASGTLASSMSVTQIKTQQDRPEDGRNDPGDAPPAGDDPGLGFLDSMLGL